MLVSVIIPAYNANSFISRCIRSITKQSHQELEIICIDDCSDDGTGATINNLATKDSRIIVIHNATRQGVSHSRNIGIKKATGEYVTFVDADDYIAIDTIADLVKTAKQNNLPDFVRYNFDNSENNYNNDIGSLADKIIKLPQDEQTIIDNFFTGNHKIPTYSVLLFVRNKIIKKIAFDENIQYLEDTLFYLRLFNASKQCVFIDKKNYYYTNNPHSTTRDFKKMPMRIISAVDVCNEIIKHDYIAQVNKGKVISSLLSLVSSQLLCLEANDGRAFCRLIKDPPFRSKIGEAVKASDTNNINRIKTIYIKLLCGKFYVLVWLFLPLAKMKYKQA